MSTIAQAEFFARVMRDSELSAGARLLYWELTQWIDTDLSVCCPTQQALADSLGISRASVIRWLKELRAHGLVEDEQIGKGNCYSVMTLYRAG